jgi:DMSO/TMAO reductase YedYZ heme-binding membrane subunit
MPLRIVAGLIGLSLFCLIIASASKKLGYQSVEHIISIVGFMALIPVLLVVCLLIFAALKELIITTFRKK